MSGPYINRGNYVYGINELTQPCPAYYNHMRQHSGRDFSKLASDKVRDDGYPYLSNSYLKEPSCCIGCGRCTRNGVSRNQLLSSVVNVETSCEKIITITFYGTSEDLDKTVTLHVGDKYCMSYVTENGVESVTGILKGVSQNMPDECTMWIGQYGNTVTTAYLELDCSTEGKSDKRMIYIASLRHIEEIYDAAYEEWEHLTQYEKLTLMTQKVTDMKFEIQKVVEALGVETPEPTDPTGPQIEPPGIIEPPSYDTIESDSDLHIVSPDGKPEGQGSKEEPEETLPETEDPETGCKCKPDHDCTCTTPGGPYIYGTVPLTKPPLFVAPWFWHDYFNHKCGCGGGGSGSGSGEGTDTGDGSETEMDAEDMLKQLLTEMGTLTDVLAAFINQYNEDADPCPCCPCTKKEE